MLHLPPIYRRASLCSVTAVCDGDVIGLGIPVDGEAQTVRIALSVADATVLAETLAERLARQRVDQPRSQSPISEGMPSLDGSPDRDGQGV